MFRRNLTYSWPLLVAACLCFLMSLMLTSIALVGLIEGARHPIRESTAFQFLGLAFTFMVILCGMANISVTLLVRKLHECEERIARLEGEQRPPDSVVSLVRKLHECEKRIALLEDERGPHD